jgi:hypothetical protein
MKLFISILILFSFTDAVFADELSDICLLSKHEIYSHLHELDFSDSLNLAYVRPKASKICPLLFRLCPRKFAKTYIQFGTVTVLRFALVQDPGEVKIRECRYKVPAAVNPGGKDDPYYSLLNW